MSSPIGMDIDRLRRAESAAITAAIKAEKEVASLARRLASAAARKASRRTGMEMEGPAAVSRRAATYKASRAQSAVQQDAVLAKVKALQRSAALARQLAAKDAAIKAYREEHKDDVEEAGLRARTLQERKDRMAAIAHEKEVAEKAKAALKKVNESVADVADMFAKLGHAPRINPANRGMGGGKKDAKAKTNKK